MSLFITAGGKTAKFLTVGATITGTISRPPHEQQQTEFGSNTPATWPNGDPKMQIVVNLDTAERDPADANDDGARTLYVSSSKMKRAIGDAIIAAGANDIEVGGTLTVTYTGTDPQSKNPANPAKLYSASYARPATPLAQQAPAATPAPAVPTPAPAPAPGPAPAAASAPAPAAAPLTGTGLTPEQATKAGQLRALQMTDEQIAAALGVTIDDVMQIPF